MSQFDWVFYLNFHADLLGADLRTEAQAKEHYQAHGLAENRRITIDIDRYMASLDLYGQSIYANWNCHSFYQWIPHLPIYLIKERQMTPSDHVLEIDSKIVCHSLSIVKHLKDGRYVGVESNKDCLEWSRRKFAGYPWVSFHSIQHGQRFKIPAEACVFDMIYATTTFMKTLPEHLLLYLQESYRVLKMGGQLHLCCFLGTQSFLLNRRSKIQITKVKGVTYMINGIGEQVIILSDTQLLQRITEAHFELTNMICGKWSENAETPFYYDLLTLTKRP